jgi:hypothetical protein
VGRKKEAKMKRVLVSATIIMMLGPAAVLAMEEGSAVVPPITKPAPVEIDPLTAAIEQARLAEDASLVMALEAQRPQPQLTGEQLLGPVLLHSSTSYSGENDPQGLPEYYSEDIKISGTVADDVEIFPDMASDSAGNLYVAWQDNYPSGTNDYIEVYKSSNGGASWTLFDSITNGSATLETPSIAVGEGSQGNTLLVAYVVDDGVADRYVEVATAPLSGGSFTAHAVTAYSDWDYFKPVITTDSHRYSVWYAFVVAEAMVLDVTTNRNVQITRSIDGGATWTDTDVLWGNSDALTWIDPDQSRGGVVGPIPAFVVCYNDSDDTLYLRKSVDAGVTWGAQTTIASPAAPTSTPVDPEIEVAHDFDTMFLAMVWRFPDSTTDDIAYAYSNDLGATWTSPYSNLRDTANTQRSPALTANEGGGGFHLVYSQGGAVYLSTRPRDLSFFTTLNELVNATGSVPSNTYPKKGIASNWDTDDVGVAWADFRQGLPVYEIYFNTNSSVIFSDGFESGNTSAWN